MDSINSNITIAGNKIVTVEPALTEVANLQFRFVIKRFPL